MPYPTPRFSSELPRSSTSTVVPRLSTTESYWTSPTTLYAHPGLDTAVRKSTSSPMESLRKAVDHMTEEYWATPSPLYTPRGSAEGSRKPDGAEKKEKREKKNLVQRVKGAVGKGTQEYWGNREMSALYGGVVPRA